MIEKRLVQWYASDTGIDLDIAEREIVLTYVLRIMANRDHLSHLAFKGGTAIRKLHLGSRGRFSLDLDFTAVSDIDPETLILDIAGAFQNQTYYGLTFSIPSSDYYATPTSAGAEILYQHDWVTDGRFGIQVSFRAKPILPIREMTFLPERYFDWLDIDLPKIPSLDLHEIIGEKVRAAAQRNRVRDLFDLYQFATHRFDRSTVRRIAVLKCWETNFTFDPEKFLASLRDGNFNWLDLRRLIRHGWDIQPEEIINHVQAGFGFLIDLTSEEATLARDPYNRQHEIYRLLVDGMRSSYNE